MPDLLSLRLKVDLDQDANYDVHAACDAQLTQDGRQPPHSPTKKMDDDYNYDSVTFDGYLTAVRARLAQKGRNFSFDHQFALDHLSDQLIALEGAIVNRLT